MNVIHRRKEIRVNDDGEFCRLEVELRDQGRGPELSICGTAGYVLTEKQAAQEAHEFWASYYDECSWSECHADEVDGIEQMTGRKFEDGDEFADHIAEVDGELAGLDVVAEEDGKVFVCHSCGQIREELARYFPEVHQFFRFHLNGMHAGCIHQDARGETYQNNPDAECLECGWKLGHGWDHRELPEAVIEWAKTGEGNAPSEPHYIAGPQWVVTGFRRKAGAEGEGERFKLNGAAPDNDAAAERAHKVLLERGYEHILVTGVTAVEKEEQR
jgi:hypothetical protein